MIADQLDIQHSKPMLERKVWPASKYIQKISGDFKMLRGDTGTFSILKSLAHIFQCLADHGLGSPGRRFQKQLLHLCVALRPDKIKWCDASAQSKPLPWRSVLSGEAWYKVTSNLLKAAWLNSELVFPVIP